MYIMQSEYTNIKIFLEETNLFLLLTDHDVIVLSFVCVYVCIIQIPTTCTSLHTCTFTIFKTYDTSRCSKFEDTREIKSFEHDLHRKCKL